MTRAETWDILAKWIEDLGDRFNLRTMDDLLGKIKELQDKTCKEKEKIFVDSYKHEAQAKWQF